MTVRWQEAHIPFAAGLNTKTDEYHLDPPGLLRCQNAEFDELGAVRKRKPYSRMPTDIVGGGSLADVRRLATYRDELLCFTKDKLYSWSQRDDGWVERAEHLATHVSEQSIAISEGEQVSADRAELDGVALYVWEEDGLVKVVATDAETGSVIHGPTGIFFGSRPRVIALQSRFLIFLVGGDHLRATSVDPDNLSTASAEFKTVVSDVGDHYDAERFSDTEAVIAAKTASGQYEVATVRESDADTVASSAKARGVLRGICLAVSPAVSPAVAVVRQHAGEVLADFLGSDLSDTSDIGVQVSDDSGVLDRMTAIWKAEDDLHVLWESEIPAFAAYGQIRRNTVDTSESSASVGTESIVASYAWLASRAFLHEGEVFVWTVFSGETGFSIPEARGRVQNTYFLLRPSDNRIHAKATMNVASGEPEYSVLPGVQHLGSGRYAWCGGERRLIPLGDNRDDYAQRGLREIVFEFDSNEARRTAQIGQTLYISGGQIRQFDGQGTAELGFNFFPWRVATQMVEGDLDAGKRFYKASYRWPNAAGETDRSTTVAMTELDVDADRNVEVSVGTIHYTDKRGVRGDCAIEVWRTAKDASVFHLITSKNPADSTGDNRYLANDTSEEVKVVEDALSDDDLISQELDPETGGVLEHLPPPPASIIVAGQDRLYLAGVAGDPHAVWYSRLRDEGEVASFHDALRVHLPSTHGAVTAIEVIHETLVVFQERAVHILPGEGFDNLGGGQNLGPPRRISSDVGAVSQESLAVMPQGILFKSAKGWYMLNRGFTVDYIGGQVDAFDDDTVLAVQVMEEQHQARVLTNARMLVWDWIAQQWAEWTISDGIHSIMWGGDHLYLSSGNTVQKQRDDFEGAHEYQLDIETAWIKLAGLQGFKRVRRYAILGEADSYSLRTRVGFDYGDEYAQDSSDAPEGVSGYALFSESGDPWSPPEGAVGPFVFEAVGPGGERKGTPSNRQAGAGGGEYARSTLATPEWPVAITVNAPASSGAVVSAVDSASETVVLAHGGTRLNSNDTNPGGSGGVGSVVTYDGGDGARGQDGGGGGGGGAGAWRSGPGADGQTPTDGSSGGAGGPGPGGAGGRGGDQDDPDPDYHGESPGGGGGGKGLTFNVSDPDRTGDGGAGFLAIYWGGHPLLSLDQIKAELGID